MFYVAQIAVNHFHNGALPSTFLSVDNNFDVSFALWQQPTTN